MMKNCVIFSIIFFNLWFVTGFADVRSTDGQINFDSQFDGQSEMTLTSIGLGLGVVPSSNLHISGNAIVSSDLTIGVSSGSSTLNINGSMSYSYQMVSSNTTLGESSIVLANSSSDNIVLTLPYAGNVVGRIYTIKKTSFLNSIWIRGGGNLIDDSSPIELTASTLTLPSVKLISHDSGWSIIAAKELSSTVASSNLLLWYKFDEESGTTAVDSSGHNNHGTLDGGLTFSTNSTTGVQGKALTFNGSSHYVTIPAGGGEWDSLTQQVTVSAWVYGDDSLPKNNSLFEAKAGATRRLNVHLPWNNERVYFHSPNNIIKTATSSEYKNEWHLWTFVANKDLNKVWIYLDGQLWHSGSGSTSIQGSTIDSFAIGSKSDGSGNYYPGTIDDFKIYNKALTSHEIQAIYQTGVTSF